MKTAEIAWQNFDTPGEVGPVITGILASDATKAADDDWTVDELQAAKPMFLYYFRQGLDDPMHEEYKFSRKFEMGLQDKSIEEINTNWMPKKVGIDLEKQIDDEEEATRIELWSAIETKMKTITMSKADQKLLNAGPLVRILKKYAKVSDGLVAKEIERIEKRAEESAAK